MVQGEGQWWLDVTWHPPVFTELSSLACCFTKGFDSFLASVSHLFNKHAADVLAAEPLCVLASMMLDSIASRHAGEERRWPLV